VTRESIGKQREQNALVLNRYARRCGLANQSGGFFLVGARRDAGSGEWVIDGVDFAGIEPATWIADVLRNGDDRLRPVPRFDVKSFDLNGNSKVVVLMVEEVASKPCMTAGRVAIRQPGQTVWVLDPAEIARLGLGSGAQEQAEQVSVRAARSLAEEATPEPPYLRFVLAFAPTRKPDDIAARIFPQSYLDAVGEAARSLPREPLFFEPSFGNDRYIPTAAAGRSAVVAQDESGRQRWTIRVAWDGSVAVRLDAPAQAPHEHRTTGDQFPLPAIRRAANAAETLVERLGGEGVAHVTLIIGAEGFEIRVEESPFTPFDLPSLARATQAPIQVWTDEDGHLQEATSERMAREFFRSCGAPVVEPESE
jgi:hypothetical protein